MIATISGRINSIREDSIVVEVSGIGFEVFIPAQMIDMLKIGESIFLHIYMVVREDSLTLYGFETEEGKEFFDMLLSVNGVGPRLAMVTLSTLTPDAIRRAVVNEQAEIFTQVPGIGKMTAGKILLQLQGKVKAIDGLEPVAAMSDTDTEVLSALTALGYSVVEAQAAIQAIPMDAPDDVETRLRQALLYFSTP
jgi:Holliday junction DNA helicase RuvA